MNSAKKLEALKNGENTDCVFQIGPDGQTQEFNACKFDLATSSEYFAGLLRSPLTPSGPIRIKHVEPKVFRMILEITHTGDLVSEIANLEECIQLAAAADEFLIGELGLLCSKTLQKEFLKLGNVWKTLNDWHRVVYVFSACQKLLCHKTDLCLKEPGFLEISEEALAKFLNLEKMNVKSEMTLVRASFAYSKAKLDENAVFRRAALPHLRLLTLTEEDLAEVAPFLTQDEKLFLVQKQNPLLANVVIPTKAKLSSNSTPRNGSSKPKQSELDLLPEDELLDLETIFRLSKYQRLPGNANKFVLKFETKKCIKIKGLYVCTPLDIPDNYFNKNLFKCIKRKRKSGGLVKDVKMKFNVKVFCNNSSRSNQWEVPDEGMEANSVLCIKKCIFVPSESQVTVEVTLTGACCIRKIEVQDVDSSRGERRAYYESLEDTFTSVSFEHQVLEPGNEAFRKCEEGNSFSIFNSICYEVV